MALAELGHANGDGQGAQERDGRMTRGLEALGRRRALDVSDKDVVVVDIGGTGIKIGHVRHGVVQSQGSRHSTSLFRGANPVEVIGGLVRDYSAREILLPALVVVTVPGFIETDFDTVLMTANVPELEGHRLASELGTLIGTPTVLERDTVLLLEGERRAGVARGRDNVLGVFLGTGIGAAYVCEGRPFRGAGWALELGHVPVRAGSGTGRPAVQRLESRASGATLVELAQHWSTPLETLFEDAARVPHRQARLLELIDDQALAIASALAILSPSVVVVGGGVLEMRGYPWARLVETVTSHSPLPASIQPVEICRAALGWQAALHGALAMAEVGGATPPTDRSV